MYRCDHTPPEVGGVIAPLAGCEGSWIASSSTARRPARMRTPCWKRVETRMDAKVRHWLHNHRHIITCQPIDGGYRLTWVKDPNSYLILSDIDAFHALAMKTLKRFEDAEKKQRSQTSVRPRRRKYKDGKLIPSWNVFRGKGTSRAALRKHCMPYVISLTATLFQIEMEESFRHPSQTE